MEQIPSTQGPRVSGDGAEETRQKVLTVMERVNHEFRTPLNQVFGLIDLLLGTSLEPDQRSLAGDLQVAASTLLDRLTDVLALTDLEAGLLDAEEAEFQPAELLERVSEASRFATSGRENRLEVIGNPDLPGVLYGDEWRIHRALVHLVGYLSRCVESATIRLSTEIENRTGDDPSIRFELCLVEGPSTTVFPENKGAADLAFARALVLALGGEVDGPSLEGTEVMIQFSLTFPNSPLGQETPCTVDSRNSGNGGAGDPKTGRSPALGDSSDTVLQETLNPRRVLLAEDNRVTQVITRKLLLRRGHQVEVANNGLEAVEMARAVSFDVVLMDLDMPEMDGLSATREIRSLASSGPPVVAFTGHVLSEDRQRCKDAGMDGFLAKPVSLDDLFHEVERWPRRSDA